MIFGPAFDRRPVSTAAPAIFDRSAHAILVPSAHSTAGVGIIRSLGAAGYRVHAAAARPDALGLRSRFAEKAIVHPPPGSPSFVEWFDDYVRRHSIEMITPGGFSDAASGVFASHNHLFTTPSEFAVREATKSKYSLFEKLLTGDAAHRAHLPPCLLVDFDAGLPSERELASLGTPLFIKLDSTEGRSAPVSTDVIRIATATSARKLLEKLADRYARALVQGFVPGRGAGAFILRWDGRIVARMMHLRLHEMPHTGGASSLRVSWWHDEMMRDAAARLARLEWRGVAMVEYRWDRPTGSFYLMEMNLRFWGSLHLALFAGVDFPRLLADAFFGHLPNQVVEARLGVVCRHTIPNEIGYLVSLWRDPSVSRWRKLSSLVEAALLTLDPRIYNDLLYPGDRLLFVHQLRDTFGLGGRRRAA